MLELVPEGLAWPEIVEQAKAIEAAGGSVRGYEGGSPALLE